MVDVTEILGISEVNDLHHVTGARTSIVVTSKR